MENNPYQSPESDIELPTTQFKRSIWWKIYFYLITVLSILGLTLMMFEPGVGLAEYLSVISLLLTTTGLFAFVFFKPIASAKIWLYILIATFAYGFIDYGITNTDLKAGISDMEFYISQIIGFALELPTYFALYAISKVDHSVWQLRKNMQ
ncbi:MAG: hypothetical protein MJK04_11665 [Psychrosphaera sp.]|nr:hypothetical protein [Psychrosphaera sp.]